MAKSSFKQIEEDKQKIIQQLVNDPRQSPHEIAEQCGFSRQKVWRIMNKLDEENRIWGYTAVVDDDNVGKNLYFALIKTKAPFYNLFEEFIDRIKDQTESKKLDLNILGVYYLNGMYDWIMMFSAPTIRIAKLICGVMQKICDKYVETIDLMENVFPLIKFGKINPNLEQLKEFTIE
jgi:DNA-binding Lrp family transcriptional regulator